MKTAIVYASVHHGNTKKLVEAIAAQAEGGDFDRCGKNQGDRSERL